MTTVPMNHPRQGPARAADQQPERPHRRLRGRCWLAAAVLVAAAAVGPAAAQVRYQLAPSGDELTDRATGLVWRRCAEGMAVVGNSCTGQPLALTHEQALVRASAQATNTGKAWRLPNVKELSSLVDRTRELPAIDTTAFPGTPHAFFWSATPYAGSSGAAWTVDFAYGGVEYRQGRPSTLAVRLVRD